MIEKIKYRQATIKDFESILVLYNNAYQSKRSVSDLQWLYEFNPMGKGTLFIAIVDSTVVGMQGIVKYQCWKSNKTIDMYKSEDSLIRSDYRGKGVYKKLYQMVFDFIDKTPIWGLTDKKTILERTGLPSEKRFNLVASVKGFVSPSLFKNEKNVWAKTLLYNSLNLSLFTKSKSNIHLRIYSTRSITDFEGIEVFGKSFAEQYQDVQVPVLSKDIIHWRLRDNPKVKNWEVFALKNENNEIKALTLITFDGKKCRWLSSYFHADVSIDYRSDHIKKVQKNLFNKGIIIIEQWLFDTNKISKSNSELMLVCGFKHVKKGLWIIKNQTKKNATVHEVLFSAQLGLD